MFMDNLNPFLKGQLRPILGFSFAEGDPPPAEPPPAEPPPAEPPPAGPPFKWKEKLGPELANSPTLQKFEDTQEGFKQAVESHLSLEKLLGHEKVPIPKGPEDAEGWNRFSKAMGIPDKAEAYGLPDAEMPESIQNIAFDKRKFAEIVHAFKLTPNQAKGLWKAYTDTTIETYNRLVKEHEATMTKVVNQLRSEWGDNYDTNVQLGQLVINKFSANQDTQDFITSILTKDPRGVRFLAKIGGQFAENKIGSFAYTKFTKAPEEAQAEIDAILRDVNHPYHSEKATDEERNRAIDYVNSLYATINKAKG